SLQQNREEKHEEGPLGVRLISVTKVYEGHKAAVQDLTLTFHGHQITALLGTNGAGKTTVISMLTGLYPPTSGTIIINGKNLQTDLSTTRTELGVCPQQDILFDNLTVLEHLLPSPHQGSYCFDPERAPPHVNKSVLENFLLLFPCKLGKASRRHFGKLFGVYEKRI
ncbi:hypothetical protein MC885_019594, partial [Smutsia gigantea]